MVGLEGDGVGGLGVGDDHPEDVAGATDYYAKGRIGLGAAAPMQTRTVVSASGSIYEDTQTALGRVRIDNPCIATVF